jgi:exopolyphosphatase/guanosine-5'-triphosphate,3'-diphosphate pyrophosphatase
MIFAAIDIGSNAARLLFANVFEKKGKIKAEKATLVRIPLRLGLDVFNTQRINEERKNYLIKTLKAYQLLIDVYQPVDYAVCATAAIREAENKDHIIQEVLKETGLNIRVIDGIEEAKIISKYNDVSHHLEHPLSIYIDVGGGSTEITHIEGSRFIRSESFKIGTIRALYDSIDGDEWKRMKHWLEDLQKYKGNINCIGSGGNINKIVKLYGSKTDMNIEFTTLVDAYDHLRSFTVEQRIKKFGFRQDRADVIVPAAKIYAKCMEWAGINNIIAPKIGLADGLVCDLYRQRVIKARALLGQAK